MADWESSSQHEFELSFHCRLELQALEGTICESSYPVFKLQKTLNNKQVYTSVFLKGFD